MPIYAQEDDEIFLKGATTTMKNKWISMELIQVRETTGISIIIYSNKSYINPKG